MRRILPFLLAAGVFLLLPFSASANPGGRGGPFFGGWGPHFDQDILPWGRPTLPPWWNQGPQSQEPNYTFTGTTGSTSLVHPGYMSETAAQVTTTGDGEGDMLTWGAVDVDIPSTLTFSQVRWLSTEYKFTLGSCWGGSPRFELWIPDASSPTGHDKVFLYIGPPTSYTGCPTDTWTNTGNLVTADSYVDDSQLPGGSYADTWSHALQLYGSDPVTAVYVDADGGWYGNQTIEFDDTQVNDTLVTYESQR